LSAVAKYTTSMCSSTAYTAAAPSASEYGSIGSGYRVHTCKRLAGHAARSRSDGKEVT
jgi:hypothetical protein